MTLAAGSAASSTSHGLFAERALSAAATVRLPNRISEIASTLMK